jgi:membrane protein DedA with SNARE-associated domain
MGSWLEVAGRHGAVLLFLFCLVEALGLPIPAAAALVTVGALAGWGKIAFLNAMAAGALAFLIADLFYFLLGRRTGWWLLSVLCRVTANPDSCVLTSAETFHRRGHAVLVGAKFLPGLSAIAAPLAGAMRMPLGEFLALDILGIFLYTGVYLSAGYLFRDALAALLSGMENAGLVLQVLIAGVVGVYAAHRAWLAWRLRGHRNVPKAEPGEVDGLVFDVRSHGYYESGAERIAGSVRLELNRLAEAVANLPEYEKIYLYCT